MTKLLTFLVDYRLNNKDQKLKAYTIAVDALGRGEDFDPQTDSYPRVQISRLRKMLEAYYLRHTDGAKLVIPRGNYEIHIVDNYNTKMETPPTVFVENKEPFPYEQEQLEPLVLTVQKPLWRQIKPHILLALAIAAIAAVVLMNNARQGAPQKVQYPSLIINPATVSKLSKNPNIARKVTGFVSSALSKFETINIYSDNEDREVDADYSLTMRVLDKDGRNINFKILNYRTGKIISSETVKIADNFEKTINKTIINIAGPYGVIATDQHVKWKGNAAVGYPCLVQFDIYLKFHDEQLIESVFDCLYETHDQNPNNAFILSQMVFADYISEQREFESRGHAFREEIAQKAIQINPNSANAAFAYARSAFFQGDCATGKRWSQKAINLNPLDTRTLGYYSIYLTACGDPKAEQVAARVLAIDPKADLIVASNLALLKILGNDFEEAYAITKKYLAGAPREEPSLLVLGAISASAVGKDAEARTLWRQTETLFEVPEQTDAKIIFEKFIINKQLVGKLEEVYHATNLSPRNTS